MSISSLTNSIAGIDREMHSLNQQIHSLTNSINNKQKEAHRIFENISREKSLTRIVSLQKDLTRKNEDIARVEKDKMGKEKTLADKQKRKYDLQQQLVKEEGKEREKALKEQKEVLAVQQQIAREVDRQRTLVRQSVPRFYEPPAAKQYDVFLSHASEDKADFVRPFVDALVTKGLQVWYDEFELKLGMSLRRTIDKGLRDSRFGIVVLSEHFFRKEWTQAELEGLFARQMNGERVILPLWHKISKDEVMAYSQMLGDMKALNTTDFTFEELAEEIATAVQKSH